MPDFSAVSLRIGDAGAEAVLKHLGDIDARGQEVAANVSKANVAAANATTTGLKTVSASQAALNEQFALAIQKLHLMGAEARNTLRAGGGLGAIQSFKETAQATREWMVAMGATEKQLNALDIATIRYSRIGLAMNQRLVQGFRGIGFAVAAAASSVSDDWTHAIQQIIAAGSGMAFMFGTTGPIIGAVASLDLAVWNHFQHMIKQFDDAMQHARDQSVALIRAGDVGQISQRMSQLFSGDYLATTGIEREGIEKARVHLQRMKDELTRLERIKRPGSTLAVESGDVTKQKAAIFEYQKALNVLEAEYGNLKNVETRLAHEEGDRAKVQLELWREAKQQTVATADLTGTYEALNRVLGGSIISFKEQGQAAETALQRVNRELDSLMSYFLSNPALMSLATARNVAANLNREAAQATGNAPLAQISIKPPSIAVPLTDWQKEFQAAGDRIANLADSTFSTALGRGLENAFSQAFDSKGVEGIIENFGKGVLSAIGGIFIQMGEVYLSYGKIMQGLAALLPNPFTAGMAGVAIGAALIALGASLEAIGGHGHGGGGHGYGGYGGGGYGSATFLGYINPAASPGAPQTPPSHTTVNATIIGKDDPKAQRQLMELIARAQRRGSTNG